MILRKGMWVRHKDRTAILVDFNNAEAWIDFVDIDDGSTIGSAIVATEEITQAKRNDLPLRRVKHLSSDQLEALGY